MTTFLHFMDCILDDPPDIPKQPRILVSFTYPGKVGRGRGSQVASHLLGFPRSWYMIFFKFKQAKKRQKRVMSSL